MEKRFLCERDEKQKKRMFNFYFCLVFSLYKVLILNMPQTSSHSLDIYSLYIFFLYINQVYNLNKFIKIKFDKCLFKTFNFIPNSSIVS